MGGSRGPGTPFTSLEKADKFLNHVESIKHMDGHPCDRIKDEVKPNGNAAELIVTGEREVTQKTAGLRGEFTYCTLGAAVEMDKLLTGENLPAFEQLGALLFHTATNQARPIAAASEEVAGVGYLGASSAQHVSLIYCPDLDFLKSLDAALTLARAKSIPARPSRTNRTWSMPPPGSSPSGSRRMPSSPSGWPLRPYLSPCTAWRSPNDHTARRHSAQPVTGRDRIQRGRGSAPDG